MEFRKWQEELLKNDPEFKKEYDSLEEEFKTIQTLINIRLKREKKVLKILDESKDLDEARNKIKEFLKP